MKADSEEQRTQAHLSQIVKTIPVGIYILRNSSSGRASFDYVSPKLAEILGVSVESMIARYEAAFEHFLPEDLVGLTELSRHLDNSQQFSWEGRLDLAGRIKWVNIQSSPEFLENGDVLSNGVVADITERKLSEERIRLNEAKYRIYVKNATEGVFATDESGNYLEVNKAASQITGYSEEELLRMNIADFLVDEPDEKELRCIREFLKTGSTKSEKRFKHKDGSIRWWAVDAVRISDGLSLAFARDITERRQQEQLIQSHLAEKELILREVHHRVKNNMGTIRSLISVQKMALTDPTAIAAFNDTLGRIDSMGVLYERLYFSPAYSELSIKEYLHTLINQVIGLFPNSTKIRIKEDIQEFSLDNKRLQSVGIIVNEILTNIMKYAFTGREEGTISVSCSSSPEGISLSVYDNGNGMPENFDLDKSPGFGLMLIKMLTKQLDGSMRVDRREGTNFVLEFKNTEA